MSTARSLTQFTVQGNRAFPLDMLRHDQCWPADTGSAFTVGLSQTHAPESPGMHKITLHTWSVGITPERWKSFGWTVISQDRV